MNVRFGLLLPHFGSAGSAALLRESVRLAEDLGFDSLWARDHLVYQPHGMEDPDPTFYEGFATLAYAAALTTTVRLGTAAAIPSRSPLHLAQLVATITELSGREFTLGLGAGFRDSEFRTTILSDTTLRVRATEVVPELIEVLRAAWSGAFEHSGPHYASPTVDIRPKPGVRPAIWYGGTSPLSLRLAVEHCDGWMPGRITHETLATRMTAVEARLDARREAEFALAVIPLVSIGESRAEAMSHVDLPSLLEYANGHRWLVPPASGTFYEPPDLAGLLLYGTPDDIVEQLLAYPAYGVTDVIFDLRLRPQDFLQNLMAIGTEVIPRIRSTSA